MALRPLLFKKQSLRIGITHVQQQTQTSLLREAPIENNAVDPFFFLEPIESRFFHSETVLECSRLGDGFSKYSIRPDTHSENGFLSARTLGDGFLSDLVFLVLSFFQSLALWKDAQKKSVQISFVSDILCTIQMPRHLNSGLRFCDHVKTSEVHVMI